MAESVEEHKREPNEEETTKPEPTKGTEERKGEEKREDAKMTEGMIPKAKLTAVSMFTSLAESVQNIQANMPDMSNYGIGRKHPDIVFPPPSWNVEELERKERAEEVPAEEKEAEGGEEAKDEKEEKREKEEPDESVPAPDTRDKPSNPPSPSSFAERLKVMIESLPVPPSVTSTVTNAINTASGSVKSLTTPQSTATVGTTTGAGEDVEHPDPSLPPLDGSGPPVPEGVDSETIKYLSSQSVMTGMANRDGASTPSARQTVWAALEKLKPGSWGKTQATTAPAPQEEGEGKEKGKPEDMTPETDEGVMMYAPLRPDDSSEVVLAECRTPGVGTSDSTSQSSTIDDKKTKGKAPATSKSKEPSQPKLWVPSTTSLSIYTTWWGYRLYIPPPIMTQLSSSQMRATKRATLITTFLQWVLTRIPTMVVPPTMRGGLVMLKRLAPIVGYVGIFVAWSWKRIQEVDEGNGVVLTATWVLPVALIPTKWDAGDVFGPVTKPEEVVVDEENRKGKGKEKEEKKEEKKGLMERVKSFSGWGKK